MNRLMKIKWTIEEDKVLATSVMKSLSKGGTAIAGIKEAAKILNSRTEEACGARWSSNLSKKPKYDLSELAEEPKIEVKYNVIPMPFVSDIPEDTFSLEEAITYLITIGENYRKLEKEIADVKEENKRLEQVQKDYEEIVNILNRASQKVIDDIGINMSK